MYVAVKGGEKAIVNAHRLLAAERRGNPQTPELSITQIREQMSLLVDRVMTEGSLYDPDLAALALKQARGDLIEAVFLVRAYRTTLPRFGYSVPADTDKMRAVRRVSAIYKDLPGGQVLGPTFDYTHRLIDFALAAEGERAEAFEAEIDADHAHMPHVTSLLDQEGLIEQEPAAEAHADVADLTRQPLDFPAGRDLRLQALARGDEGFVLALGYSTQRGYGRTHPFTGEIRIGHVELSFVSEELGFEVPLGEIMVTECEMVTQFKGSSSAPPQFTRGYGFAFGHAERKAMAMALVDRALRAREFGEEITAPAQDEEFVLAHCDNLQSTGFVEHLKLPHYVDFQAELELVRTMRAEHAQRYSQESTQEAAE